MSSSAPILLYSPQSGLCNQILALLNGLVKNKTTHASFKISPFLSCIHEQILVSAHNIFDLEAMSSLLGVDFEDTPVFKILYGIEGRYKDITQDIVTRRIIIIPNDDVIRAELLGDPLFGVKKHVVVYTEGQRKILDDREGPHLLKLPEKFFNWNEVECMMEWYDIYPEFDNYFKALRFHPKFNMIADESLSKSGVDLTKPINVVHLRVEGDGLDHWSKMNKMTRRNFEIKLHQIYRDLVSNIPEREQLIILTYDHNHSLITEWKDKYQIHVFNHKSTIRGREIHAIIDLLIGIQCNSIFIGCHNLELKRGSTFSYFLHKMIPAEVKRYWIDLDCL